MSVGVKWCQMVSGSVRWCQRLSYGFRGDRLCQGMSDDVSKNQTLSSEISKYRKNKDVVCK